MGWEFWPGWLLVAVVGASVGSFLNVVVYRVPRQLSLIHPPSHCPSCGTRLGPTENVPILGWIALKGRCRHCGTSISIRYPIVEAFTMGLYLLCVAVWGWSWTAASGALLLSWLFPLALIDIETYLLPELLTRSALVTALLLRLALPLLNGGGATAVASSLLDGAIGMTVGIVSLEAIGWIGLLFLGKEAMGGGDGKLMAAIGLWLGWRAVLVSIFVACLLGTVFGIALKLVRGKQWSKPIPFGPYLVLGAVTAMFFGPQIVDWYWGLAVAP